MELITKNYKGFVTGKKCEKILNVSDFLHFHNSEKCRTKYRMTKSSLLGEKCEIIPSLSVFFTLPHPWEVQN